MKVFGYANVGKIIATEGSANDPGIGDRPFGPQLPMTTNPMQSKQILRVAVFDRVPLAPGRAKQQFVSRELIENDITCATAESCTGGLLGAALTDVPGISDVFLAGMVTYSDESMVRDLGVPAGLIEQQGAVSVEVAEAMARGIVARTGAYLGIAITGIAGPDGGTAEKPVGTVCFGLSLGGDIRAHERRFGNLGREFVRRRSVWEALATVHRALTS